MPEPKVVVQSSSPQDHVVSLYFFLSEVSFIFLPVASIITYTSQRYDSGVLSLVLP